MQSAQNIHRNQLGSQINQRVHGGIVNHITDVHDERHDKLQITAPSKPAPVGEHFRIVEAIPTQRAFRTDFGGVLSEGWRWCGRGESAVNVLAVSDCEHHDGQFLVLYVTHQAVITNPVFPESAERSFEGLTQPARVEVSFYAGFQEFDDRRWSGLSSLENCLSAALLNSAFQAMAHFHFGQAESAPAFFLCADGVLIIDGVFDITGYRFAHDGGFGFSGLLGELFDPDCQFLIDFHIQHGTSPRSLSFNFTPEQAKEKVGQAHLFGTG